jgi:hypothetical protein
MLTVVLAGGVGVVDGPVGPGLDEPPPPQETAHNTRTDKPMESSSIFFMPVRKGKGDAAGNQRILRDVHRHGLRCP